MRKPIVRVSLRIGSLMKSNSHTPGTSSKASTRMTSEKGLNWWKVCRLWMCVCACYRTISTYVCVVCSVNTAFLPRLYPDNLVFNRHTVSSWFSTSCTQNTETTVLKWWDRDVIMVCFMTILEMIKPGKDQRDYYYFMALGHYKLEVNNCLKTP